MVYFYEMQKNRKTLRHWPVASPTSPWCFSKVALKKDTKRLDLFEWIAVSAKLSFKKNVSYFLSAIFWNSTWDQNFVSLSSCCVLSCRKNCTGAAKPQDTSDQHSRPQSCFGAWKKKLVGGLTQPTWKICSSTWDDFPSCENSQKICALPVA